jgi:hypothetical protein
MPHARSLTPARFRPTPSALDLSAAAEANSDFARLDDYRDMATTLGIAQHLLEAFLVFQDIDVIERNFPAGEVLTGSRGVGSKILSEYQYFLACHRAARFSLLNLSRAMSI